MGSAKKQASGPIRNKIKESGLIVFDMEAFKPEGEVVDFDIASLLEKGMIARRDSFTSMLQKVNWDQYADKHVAIHCSTDAILPPWPFLMVTSKLQPVAQTVGFGDRESYKMDLWKSNIDQWDIAQFGGERVILKANKHVPHEIFQKAGYRLQEVVQTLMYGMPANTVPIYKRKI